MKSLRIRVQKLHPDAHVPTYGHQGDAGLGLYSIEQKTLLPGQRYSFSTGIAIELPEGHVGLIWERSGLSHTHGLIVLGGVIDSTYRGEIKVGLLNTSSEPYNVEAGHKIAQIIIQPFVTAELIGSETLSETARGENAFGSTGY